MEGKMAGSRLPFLAIFLIGGGQAMVSASLLTEGECRAGGGACVPAGKCSSPDWAEAACKGQGATVCCNPSTKQVSERILDLDSFDFDFRKNPCSDRKCLRWYEGFWLADPANCSPKQRIVNYCPTTNLWCCAPPCSRRSRCEALGGYCVSRRSRCPSGRSRHRLCGGKMCFCCLPPWPEAPCACEHNQDSICSGVDIDIPDDVCIQLRSPNFPLAYDDDLFCSLQVSAHCKITVEFCDLALERCPYDFLSVSDGNASVSYCGAVSPPPFETDANSVQITFSSDSSQVDRGFDLIVTSNCSCASYPIYTVCPSNVLVTDFGGVLITPGYPGVYPNFVSCSYTLVAPVGSIFHFQYLAFSLEPSFPSCEFDYVQIYDSNAPTSTRYCGNTPPSFPTSATNEVVINFVTDKTQVYSGFEICAMVLPP